MEWEGSAKEMIRYFASERASLPARGAHGASHSEATGMAGLAHRSPDTFGWRGLREPCRE